MVWSLKNAADKAYVNLSGSGKIGPKAVLAPVEVTVVATSKDGLAKDEHTITVYPKSEGQLVLMDAQGSYVTKTTQTLDINKMSAITLGAYTYGGSEEAVQWSYKLSKNATATEENGRLTIQMTGAGSMNVTAIAADGRKAVVTIKDAKLASGVTISQKKTGATGDLEMASGMSLDLQAKAADAASQKVAWSITEGSEYATITSSGTVKAVKDLTSAKTVKVKATATDGSNAAGETTITIRPLAQGVQVYTEEGGRMLFSVRSTPSWWVRSNTTLEWDLSTQGSTIDLNSHVYPYYGDGEETAERNAMQGVTWKSSSPKIADVVDGQVVIYKTGTVTITATANDGSKQKVSGGSPS